MKFKSWIRILFTGLVLVRCGSNDHKQAPAEKGSVAVAGTETANSNSNITTDNILDSMIIASEGIAEKKQNRVTENDGDWSAQTVVLANTQEAEWMLRAGDI